MVNQEEDTPLTLECAHGNLDWVKTLISEHVDPNGEHYFQARLIMFRKLYNPFLEGTTNVHETYNLIIQTVNIILLDPMRSKASNCVAYVVAHYWLLLFFQ